MENIELIYFVGFIKEKRKKNTVKNLGLLD
jgi:hypothetical protein